MNTLTSKTNHGNSDVAVAGCNCEACFNLRGELVNSHCAECGMALITAGEYHPYAACALYKQWGDSHAVRANLAAIIEHGNKPTGNETYDGLPVSQEPKYTVTNGRLVNRASGKPIPDDEPVFILRAKDRVAVYAIMAYRAQCTGNPEHHDAVDARVGDFLQFKEAHPQRIKSPDTTALKASE